MRHRGEERFSEAMIRRLIILSMAFGGSFVRLRLRSLVVSDLPAVFAEHSVGKTADGARDFLFSAPDFNVSAIGLSSQSS